MAEPDTLDPRDREVAAVMPWMLPGGRREAVPVLDMDVFVGTTMHQRVSGLVLEAFDQGALADPPDETRPRLVEAQLAALRSSLAAEAASVTVSELFRLGPVSATPC